MSDETVLSIRVKGGIKENLEELAKEKGLTITGIVREIKIEAFKPEKRVNKYKFLDDGCQLRDYLDEEEAPKGKSYGEGFYCMEKAPKSLITKMMTW